MKLGELIMVFIGFSLFTGLLHIDEGFTCSDFDFQDLTTAQECSDAVTYATLFNENARYVAEGSWHFNPKGCSLYNSGEMYFNSHPTGRNNRETISICWKGN